MIDLEQTRAYPPKEDTKYKLKKYILVFIKAFLIRSASSVLILLIKQIIANFPFFLVWIRIKIIY